VIPFFVPPLRDRREDVPQLAEHFLREFTTAYGRKPKELTPEAFQALAEHHWPGNVRELKESDRADRDSESAGACGCPAYSVECAASGGTSAGALRQSTGSAGSGGARVHLKKLEETHGNVSRTAELLGLERSNLYRKMKALGIGQGE